MTDEVVMGLLGSQGIRVVVATATDVARTAREKHKARTAAAAVLAEGLVASSLLSALQLQKSSARINLQLECDGPLRGIFVESAADGGLRGFVKNPFVEMQGQAGTYQWRPVLGNQGFLSVLRDQGGGEFFRSAVELEAFHLPEDFERYFAVSEQVTTGVAIEVLPLGDDALGQVAGVLLQTLPDGDVAGLKALRDRLVLGGLREAMQALGVDLSASALVSRLFDGTDFEVTSRYPLTWRCTCSKERVLRSLLTLGKDELLDVLAKDKRADATCQFCGTEYVVNAEELCALIDQLDAQAR